MIKIRGERETDVVWQWCSMAFESSVVPEEWKTTIIVPLCECKMERTKCKD